MTDLVKRLEDSRSYVSETGAPSVTITLLPHDLDTIISALSGDGMGWRPIETAPKGFDTDVELPAGLPLKRLRMGPVIKVRGTHEGETAEFFVHWAQNDDKPAHWFIFDSEPLHWPITEWRHLTPEEEAELYGDDENAPALTNDKEG